MFIHQRRDNLILWITFGAFFCLFVYGFVDNLKGATLPPLMADLQFSYSQGGAIQQGAYSGFLTATLITGLLINRFGYRDVLLIGGACLLAGMFGSWAVGFIADLADMQIGFALLSLMVVLLMVTVMILIFLWSKK